MDAVCVAIGPAGKMLERRPLASRATATGRCDLSLDLVGHPTLPAEPDQPRC